MAAEISVGEHPTFHFLGMTFNIDTMYTTGIAAVVTVLFMWWVMRKATSGVPGKAQVIVETVINQTRTYVEDAVGHDVPPWLVPMGVALFFFILFCNWFEWFPSGHHPERLGPPTADTNLTFALTVVVMASYIYLGVKRKGRRYVTDWLTADPAIRRPVLIIEQLVNPLSLSLRLFGNVLAGGIMLAVIGLLPIAWIWLYGPANVVWKLFDAGLIFPIQAFIFSFLTILYFGFAVSEEH
ncbi:MAG TPA: F0F1 ATP synthase subunit A [Mycobacteriales bacterium]|nr:F0F1 ATP synthase subunit A [Mycobacteriales bacterium]